MEDRPLELSEAEFDHIEDTIARTAKGRAFLRRYHRRSMGAATGEIRAMLGEIRDTWHRQSEVFQKAEHIAVLRRELIEMAASIEKARNEVAALRPPDSDSNRIVSATNELDAIVISTERASFEILNSAERLMDLASRLRQSGADSGMCAEIENEVTAIFTACSFQDLTGQRTSKVVNALRYIEQRITAVISIWGFDGSQGANPAALALMEPQDKRPDAHLLNGPALEGQGIDQSAVDSMFDSIPAFPKAAPVEEDTHAAEDESHADADLAAAWAAESEPEPEPEPAPPPPPPPPPPPKAAPPKAAAPKAMPPPAAALDQSAIDALFG